MIRYPIGEKADVGLEKYSKDTLEKFDQDIINKRVKLYTDDWLRGQGVFSIFSEHVRDNKALYGNKNMGEIYAVSLAQTISMCVLVTFDAKRWKFYSRLLENDDAITVILFVDLLILRYLGGEG